MKKIILLISSYIMMVSIIYGQEPLLPSRSIIKYNEPGSESVLDSSSLFYAPISAENRRDFSLLKKQIIGQYGDFRSSPKRGHKHAGIDILGDFNETVHAIGKGIVIQIFRHFPHKTIVIKHDIQTEDSLYSVYTHVEEIQVRIGDRVTHETPIARLFTQEELARSNFGTMNHLHFEMRTSIADNGRASWASMTLPELSRYCMDPLLFFKQQFKEESTAK
jgi:murein DD-endopeptidase MepM/ murein hydrolase activator NlpD